MGKNAIETIMGTVVLLVAGLFLGFAYSRADLRPPQGYELKASFASIGGLEMGSAVQINGIKVARWSASGSTTRPSRPSWS